MKGIFDVHGDHVRMKYFYIISTKCIFELQCTAAFFNIYQNDIDSKDKVNCGLRGRMKQQRFSKTQRINVALINALTSD